MIAVRAKSLVPKEWGGQARLAKTMQVSEALLSQATAVATHAPDLADSVVSGAVSLDAAYETARTGRRDAAWSGSGAAGLANHQRVQGVA